jgi:hypothetical protein
VAQGTLREGGRGGLRAATGSFLPSLSMHRTSRRSSGLGSISRNLPPVVARYLADDVAGDDSGVSGMSLGAAIALGALVGLALGVLLSVTTSVPLGPELGLVLGGLVGWLSRRNSGQ